MSKLLLLSFEREIGESVWINGALKEGIELLNSKNEYNRCSIPRLGLTLDKEQKIEEYKDKQAELEIKRRVITLAGYEYDAILE